jgi:proteasome lid subunit RPN8/RPN11
MPTSTESPRLLVPRPILAAMLEHAVAEMPNECCGLLGGVADDGGRFRVRSCHPLVNAAASPTEYESSGESILAAYQNMRDKGCDLVAIYHSHPAAPPVPSRKDLERNYYGETAVHLIISLQTAQPEVRGWWLTATDYREADWECVEEASA